MAPKIIKVTANNDYTLTLKYESNEIKKFDMNPYLSIGKFTELKNLDMFRTAHISFDAIEWANGMDIDPGFLYERASKEATTTIA